MLYRLYLLLLLPLLLTTSCYTRTENAENLESEAETAFVPIPAEIDTDDFDEQVQELLETDELKHALVGIYVIDAATGDEVYSHNGEIGMATGSTMKVITTATALEALGSDFTFTTQLALRGTLSGSTLNGDLVIIGGGDPTLGNGHFDYQLDDWVKAVKAKGITKITGRVVGDARVYEFPMAPRNWTFEDIGNYYGSGASGLNINGNTYQLYFKPGKQGDIAQVLHTEPQVPSDMQFYSQVLTGPRNSGDEAYIFGTPYTKFRYITGSIPGGRSEFMIKGSLPDPGYFAAYSLQQELEKAGISVADDATTYYLTDSAKLNTSMPEVIHTTASPNLFEVAKETNLESDNLFAESQLKMLGVKLAGEGSTEAATKAVTEYWREKGVDMDGFFMEDGSGLSRFNSVTPKQMASILYQARKLNSGNDFKNTLPVAGKSGTLRSMSRGRPAQGRITAKSGTIKRVRSYCGYARNADGKELVFAIFINNYSGKTKALTKPYEQLFDNLVALTDW